MLKDEMMYVRAFLLSLIFSMYENESAIFLWLMYEPSIFIHIVCHLISPSFLWAPFSYFIAEFNLVQIQDEVIVSDAERLRITQTNVKTVLSFSA